MACPSEIHTAREHASCSSRVRHRTKRVLLRACSHQAIDLSWPIPVAPIESSLFVKRLLGHWARVPSVWGVEVGWRSVVG
jgi:hypothetical protein